MSDELRQLVSHHGHSSPMYLLYSILLTIGVIALLPRLVADAFRHGKYVTGLGERLGRLPPFVRNQDPVIWLHCVSVGETQAARSLVTGLRERFQNHSLVVSTTTLTGQRIAREVFRDDAARVFYFPFDWSWTVRRSLNSIHPAIVVIMETEIWPNFLRECRRRHIKTVIVNGRLSERSFRRFSMIRRFISRILANLNLALMQTELDATRMRDLGLPSDRVKVTGNLKYDAATESAEGALTSELRERFGFTSERPLVVAASTHPAEERITIEAFKKLHADETIKTPRLLIAPRHPERFAEVASLLAESGLAWSRRTNAPNTRDSTCDVLLLDSIGELRLVYPLAEIVFVGGSIAQTGGHNVLEPIAAGKCVVTGAHTSNFSEIVETFVREDALVQLPPVEGEEASRLLASTFKNLLGDNARRSGIASRASKILEQNRGATERTIDLLSNLLTRRSIEG